MLSVALCTFNGEHYLAEQLQSIIDQSLPPDEIVICDDRSTDGTVDLINRFTVTACVPIRLFVQDTTVGVVRNFESALSKCRGDMIALSDQDDVWLPDKLAHSVAALAKAMTNGSAYRPLLVHTDLRIVDETKRTLADSFFAFQEIDPASDQSLARLLLENSVTGCTMLFNSRLRDLALPIPPAALMHDWWISLVAAANGGVIVLPEATILYRQHGGNAVGARRKKTRKTGTRMDRFTAQVERRIAQLEALSKHPGLDDANEKREIVNAAVQDLRRGGPFGALRLYRQGIGLRGAKRSASLYLAIALGAFGRR